MAAAFGGRDGIMTGSSDSFPVRVSGLVIQTDAPLPGLRQLDMSEPPDVRVSMRGAIGAPSTSDADGVWYVSPYLDERGVPLLTIRHAAFGYLLCYCEGATFLVSASGSEVDAWWDPPLTEADVADYLLGGVLAFVVRLRGSVPLHASAVAVHDRAVLFAGDAGAGKSSLAAAFAILGYPVLADDVVVIDDSRACVRAFPSHPRLSMWSDSANRLFATKSLPSHSSEYEKRRLDLLEHGYRFHERPLAVGMICILGSRTASGRGPVIRELRSQDALMKLVRHTYGNYLLDASMRAREFDILVHVAATVCIGELSLTPSLDELVADCRRLADSLAIQSAAQAT